MLYSYNAMIFKRLLCCPFGLTQKDQKVKADEGMSAKATREIIHATQAVRSYIRENFTLYFF